MKFETWLGALLADATVSNRAASVGRLGLHVLRELYDKGAEPSAGAILRHLNQLLEEEQRLEQRIRDSGNEA